MKRQFNLALGVAVLLAFPLVGSAQKGENKHKPAPDALVDFGVLPNGPLGTAAEGCIQSGTGIGGPADPCAYRLHHLTPEEATVARGGQVTFEVHGGGHAPALYRVSKETTRNDLGQFLCAGLDPEHITNPLAHVCDLSAANANAAHVIKDGDGDVVIVADANPTAANVHPLNRVWSEPGRLMSAGGKQFINGGTVVAAGTPSNGTLVTYRFLKSGRYLVICMNRTHFLNDWMFGFVNVVGGGDDDDDR
jgi:hypothetical protein